MRKIWIRQFVAFEAAPPSEKPRRSVSCPARSRGRPWWLIRHRRGKRALRVLRRSGARYSPVQVVPLTPPHPQCSIALWRGYVAAQFYARARDRDEAFGFSQSFRTRRMPWEARVPIEEDPRALAALEALESELLARGWERMRRAPGAEWFELRFRRSAAEPVSSSRLRVRLNAVSSAPEAVTS
jgi:hypothetical protein